MAEDVKANDVLVYPNRTWIVSAVYHEPNSSDSLVALRDTNDPAPLERAFVKLREIPQRVVFRTTVV